MKTYMNTEVPCKPNFKVTVVRQWMPNKNLVFLLTWKNAITKLKAFVKMVWDKFLHF